MKISGEQKLPMVFQTEAAECGLACLAMIAGYHGLRADLPALRQRFLISLRDATLNHIIKFAAALDLTGRPLRVELEDLPYLKTPCILHWKMDHFVVLKKVTRKYIYLLDPSMGPRRPEDDNHTAPIKWALEKASQKVVCWAGLSWTDQGQSSLLMNGDDTLIVGGHSVDAGDVIWIRRPEVPVHNPKVSEADKKFAALEYRCFYHSIAYFFETLPVWCINNYSAARVMIQKAVQIRLARQCGLKTPATLMSNNPGAVREFFVRENARTICKGFTPHVWQKEGKMSVAITETFELTSDQLPSDEVLTYAPAIYQERVPKEYDVRMVLMGSHIYSYTLKNKKQALDWRQDAGLGHVTAELVPTPPDVEKGVLEFARRSGMCFGSLDFGVDAQGTWWFLEINEEGQFLWIDQFNRDARLLEKFCAFVTAPQGSTLPLEARQDLFPSLQEYEELLKNEHVPPVGRPRQEDPFLSMEA